MRLGGWILTGAAFAGLGLAAAATSRRYHTRKIESETQKNPAPTPSRAEPEGGWQARWQARAEEAIAECRVSSDSWRSAGMCAMDHAFPEGAPWTGERARWPAWSRAAQAAVDRELREQVIQALGEFKPEHWHLDWWLRSGRLPKTMTAQAAGQALWPAESWPAQASDPAWKRSAWQLLNRRFVSDSVVVG